MAEQIVSIAAISQQRFHSNSLIGHRCISKGSEHGVTRPWIWKQRLHKKGLTKFPFLLKRLGRYIPKQSDILYYRWWKGVIFFFFESASDMHRRGLTRGLWRIPITELDGQDHQPCNVVEKWTHIHSFSTAPCTLQLCWNSAIFSLLRNDQWWFDIATYCVLYSNFVNHKNKHCFSPKKCHASFTLWLLQSHYFHNPHVKWISIKRPKKLAL